MQQLPRIHSRFSFVFFPCMKNDRAQTQKAFCKKPFVVVNRHAHISCISLMLMGDSNGGPVPSLLKNPFYVCLFVCFTADDRKEVQNPAIKA